MNKEIDESPYCEICGTCGCIGCCGIRNFISEHIEGKTNCKNEGWIIQDLINLCDYKDEVFKQNKKYKELLDKIKEKGVMYYDPEYSKIYGELCSMPGANNTRTPVIVIDDEILKLLEEIE